MKQQFFSIIDSLINRSRSIYLDFRNWLRPTYRYDQRLSLYKRYNRHGLVAAWLMVLFLLFAFGLPSQSTETDDMAAQPITIERVNQTKVRYQLDQTSIKWPDVGQAAIGVVGSGVVAESNPDQKAVPMASIAKVMTALILLEDQPLMPGEKGPVVDLTAADVEIYNQYVQRNGSVLPAEAGTSISYYDALQAMLIRSANNYADSLVIKRFGSIEAYLKLANDKAAELGLNNTNFADTTGFSPNTKSTPAELVLLGEIAMQHPIISEIVGKWQTDIAGIGTIYNTNNFLDFEDNGVIGIKTGDTDEAGGTYLVAARRIIDQEPVIIVAAILGGENHFTGQQTAMPLINQAQKALKVTE